MSEHPHTDASVSGDKYHDMLALADAFDRSGEEMRARSRIGAEVLTDPDVSASAALAPGSFAQAEEDIRVATTGKRGLLTRSVELDADALVVRATVLTYRWIDELQTAAYRTLGSIAGRAIGYLAPEVALGGAIVSAGLIETDAMDREGVAAYLNELAENNPAFAEHVATGGGLIDGLQMRSLLTAGVLAGDAGPMAGPGAVCGRSGCSRSPPPRPPRCATWPARCPSPTPTSCRPPPATSCPRTWVTWWRRLSWPVRYGSARWPGTVSWRG